MDEVKTGVDELMGLLAKTKRMSLPDAAKALKQPESVVQNWVDFLVEERLLGVEYKFTTPFIYLNQSEQKAAAVAGTEPTIEDVKKEFLRRAKEKGIPATKLKSLWENHLQAAVDARFDYFRIECQKRNLTGIDDLFKRYKEKVLKENELG